MATYRSEQLINNVPIPSHGLGSAVHCQRFKVTLSAAVTTATVIQFGYVPKYARIVDATLKSTDIDTGSAAITLHVGDAGDVDRLFASSTVGQAGTVERMSAATGFGYRYDDETLITGAVAVNPATGAAGTLELYLHYVIEDDGVGYPD